MSSVPKPDVDFLREQQHLQQKNNSTLVQLASELAASVEERTREIKDLNDKIEALELQIKCGKIHRMKKDLENATLKSELTTKNSEIEELKARVSRLVGEKIGWSQRAETVEEREKGLYEKVNSFTLRCAQLETEKNVLVSEMGIRERKYIGLEERVSYLEGVAVSVTNRQGQNGGDRLNLPTIVVQPPTEIIDIIDSDEDAPAVLKSEKEASNGTPSLKRKDIDISSPSIRSKMKKLPDSIPESGKSAAATSTNAEKNSAPLTKGPLKKGSTERKKNIFSEGCLDSDDSSSSSSESEDNVNVCRLLLTSHTKNTKKWRSREEMQAAIKEDDELPMMAICALHRENIFLKSLYLDSFPGLNRSDAHRGVELAKFLSGGTLSKKLSKSVKDLTQHDANGLDDCKRLAMTLSELLFQIYMKEGDSMFLH